MFETKRSYWRKLDNAAKLFSATSNKKDTRVFRFYCELNEMIEESTLQEALNRTLKKYPIFLSVMRTGIFWHYLEKSKLRPVVREEYKDPCRNLYVRDKKELLFEVTYYKNRINFEVYHALTDGTGATEFVRELVKNYLVEAHKEEGLADISLTEDITIEDQEKDSFVKYSSSKKIKRVKKPRAFQIRKPRKEKGRLQITEGQLSVQALLAKSRELGVSMTVYLTAVYMCAIHQEMTKLQEKFPVILMVPVNLRKFFPSASMLNFFGWIEPGYKFGDGGEDDFMKVLMHVKETFNQELTKEKVQERMDGYMALEWNPILKLVPLSLKNLCINAGARISERDVTAVFSNMGVVKMPAEYVPYIKRFGVFTSTPKIELCMCSFGDVISLGFTSFFDTTNIKRNFFRILKNQGVQSEIVEPDYPKAAEEDYRGMKVFKGFTFACAASAVICGIINMSLTPDSFWSLFAIGGIASMWFVFSIAFRKRHNLMKNALWQMIIATVGCIIWDLSVGWRGWSIDYVFPIVCIVIQVSMLIISRVRKQTAREYMIYFVASSVYGMVFPLSFYFLKMLKLTFPSTICVGCSVLFFISLLIFKNKEFREEMHKKFHL